MASPVVDARFCVPRTMPLTLTMNLTLGGAVTDASGATVLQIDAPFLGVLRRFVLADVAGRPILSIQKALRWVAFRGDSRDARNLLFTARRLPLIFQAWKQMGVFLAPNSPWRGAAACDFTMKCGCFHRSCDVYLGKSSTKIAQVRRQFSASGALLGREKFSVTVFPNVDYVFVAALVVILRDIIHTAEIDPRRLE